MSQVQVTKLATYTWIAPLPDVVTVTKLATYIWLVPGDSTDTSERQGFCYAQRVERD